MESMLPMRYFSVIFTLTVAAADSSGALKNNHEVLGITRAATFEDIQNAFQKLSNMYRDRRMDGEPPVPALVEIQHAYEAISNRDMQADALRFVDYWGYVTPLEDDMALRRFLEFQPSGSSRLRMVVVVKSNSPEEDDNQHFELYASAVKYGHRIRVGQISAADALAPNGEPAEFLKFLQLHRYPAVVLMDPITRIKKVRYILDGISGEVEKILNGGLGSDDKLGWLQEFDADAYKSRCQSSHEDAVPCSSIFLFATSDELEQRRDDLKTAAESFHEACKTLTVTDSSAACFWLRRGRATEWDRILQQKFAASITGDSFGVAVKIASPDPPKISLAPQGVIGGDVDRVTAWFNDVLEEKETMQALVTWPTLPKTLRITDEPVEEDYSKMLRKAMFHAECVFYSECRAKQKDELALQLHVLMQKYGLYEYYVQLLGAESETLTAVAGVAVLILCALFAICKKCCCGRRGSKTKSEAEACESAEFIFAVTLTKPSADTKLGMDLGSHTAGGLAINAVNSGQLVDYLNSQEPRTERRIRTGDRIACVSGVVDGTQSSQRQKDGMLPILKGMQSTLTIARRVGAKDKDVQRIVGTCNLCIAFHGNVELGPVDGGAPTDIEIKSLHPALLQWNEAKTQEGACCTQRLEVGDRIISVAENTNVLVPPKEEAPIIPIVFVRWRSASSIKPHQVQVNMERTADQRWGMKIRTRICEPKQLEILDIVPEGALATIWNANQSNPQILRGDRIVQVGDRTDKEGISAGLQSANLSIRFERWTDTSAPVDTSAVSNGIHKEVPAVPSTPGMPFPTAQSPLGMPGMPGMPSPPGQTTAVAPPIKPISAPVSAPLSAPAPTARTLPPARPQPMVASSSAPLQVGGDAFPWLPVLFTMILGTLFVLGGLNGEKKGSETAKRMPLQAEMYLKKINPDLYPEVAGFLLLLGLLMAVNFFRNEFLESSSPGRGGGVLQQLCGAAVASTFLGFGSFFLQAWSGVYA